LLSPELRVTGVRWSGRRITIRGRIALGANGKLTATWTPRRTTRQHARQRSTRTTTYAHGQAFTVRLKLPRARRTATRGTLVIHYASGDGFVSQTRRLAVRRGAD
jgi:hypothetical protein